MLVADIAVGDPVLNLRTSLLHRKDSVICPKRSIGSTRKKGRDQRGSYKICYIKNQLLNNPKNPQPMKTLHLKMAGMAFLFLYSFSASAQSWLVGGNSTSLMGPAGTEPIIGTLVGNNQPLLFYTNGAQRMHISENLGNSEGFVGIGLNFLTPEYLLHINGMNNNTGKVFKTTGPDHLPNRWVMAVQGNPQTQETDAERFFIENPVAIPGWPRSNFNADMGTSRDGEINFFTNRDNVMTGGMPLKRSVSIQGGSGNSAHGQVAMGNQLPDGFDAKSRLHLHQSTSGTASNPGGNFIQFTNTNTIGGDVPVEYSGLQVGIANNRDAYIRQNEDRRIIFTTGDPHSVRMVILSNLGGNNEGYIGMNTANPTSRLDINGDLRIRDVQDESSDALLLGQYVHSGTPEDLNVRRLDFNGQSDYYLAGNGQWVQLPTSGNLLPENNATRGFGQYATGKWGSGKFKPSDAQFKTRVDNLDGALSIIRKIQPRTYYYDTVNYAQFELEPVQKMGIIAEEIESILPNVVSVSKTDATYDSNGAVVSPSVSYKTIEYDELVSLLVAGMKEQQAMIDSLANQLASVQNCLNSAGICSADAQAPQQTSEMEQQRIAHSMDVRINNHEHIILNQNVPNPFAEKTVITYYIPESVIKAQIHFYNNEGRLINSVDINERGNGQLNVFADDLSSGIYTYSLVADGTFVVSKRMVKN